MLISPRKKFIFIHNYKVAGTSLRSALAEYSLENSFLVHKIYYKLFQLNNINWNNLHAHSKAKEIKAILGNKIYSSYFTFGFVRNPWDYQVSLYKYMLQNTNHFQHELIKKMHTFENYIEWRVNNEVKLQKDFFYDNDKCIVDYIGKIENLESDIANIGGRLNLDIIIPHLNKSRPDNEYLSFYNENTAQKIQEAFQEDILLFDYKTPILK